jgi:hypothetical protein
MKTLNKIILATFVSTQALAFVQINKMKKNIKEAEKLEPVKTLIKTIDVDHNGERISISIFHTNVLNGLTIPNAWAETTRYLNGKAEHTITIQDSLVGTDMYDAVLTHEIGHIVLGHTSRISFLDDAMDIVKRELEADAYSVSKGHIKGMIKFRTNALKYTGLLLDYNQPCLLALLAKKVFN